MSSKMVNGRLATTLMLVSAAEEFLPVFDQRADALMGEGTADSFKTTVDRAMRVVTRAANRLEVAERRLKSEREMSRQATATRDQCSARCRATLVQLRITMQGLFGDEYARSLGFVGATPERAPAIYRLAAAVVSRAREAKKPEAASGELAIDPIAVVQPLVELAAQVDRGISAAAAGEHAVALAQVEKNGAIADFDRASSAAARVLSGLLNLVGAHDLARKVLPPTRKRRKAGADGSSSTNPGSSSDAARSGAPDSGSDDSGISAAG